MGLRNLITLGKTVPAASILPSALPGLMFWYNFRNNATLTTSGSVITQVTDPTSTGPALAPDSGFTGPNLVTGVLNGQQAAQFPLMPGSAAKFNLVSATAPTGLSLGGAFSYWVIYQLFSTGPDGSTLTFPVAQFQDSAGMDTWSHQIINFGNSQVAMPGFITGGGLANSSWPSIFGWFTSSSFTNIGSNPGFGAGPMAGQVAGTFNIATNFIYDGSASYTGASAYLSNNAQAVGGNSRDDNWYDGNKFASPTQRIVLGLSSFTENQQAATGSSMYMFEIFACAGAVDTATRMGIQAYISSVYGI